MHPNQDLLKIAFITTVDRNPGDAFIRAGIEYLLQQHIPHYRGVYVDKHEYRSNTAGGGIKDRLLSGAKRLLRVGIPCSDDPLSGADLIVQAGAPLYYISPGKDGTYASFSSSITTDWVSEIWLKRLLHLSSPPPLLNLAVGTCQPFRSDTSEFDHSPALLEFIHTTVNVSALTTVRENTAARLLERCGLQVPCLPCTAIFATDHHRIYPERPQFVCLNFMEGGAHYTLGQEIDFENWRCTFRAIYEFLSKQYPVVVMCHSPGEVLSVRSLLPESDTFFSPNYEDYLRMYAKSRFGVLNRVHGAMVLAGLGRPAIVVGNDSRSRMGELMHLPVSFVNDATPENLLAHCADFAAQPEAWSDKLLATKSASRLQYLHLLEGCLTTVRSKGCKAASYMRSDFGKMAGHG